MLLVIGVTFVLLSYLFLETAIIIKTELKNFFLLIF